MARKRRRDAFLRLRRFPGYPELVERLRAGVGITKLVSWLAAEGVAKGIEEASLARSLQRLRQSLEETSPQMDLQELSDLEQLYWQQRDRIASSVETEERVGMLLPGTGSEIRRAAELLERIRAIRERLGVDYRGDRLRVNPQVRC